MNRYDLSDLNNIHNGERCYVFGSGVSLDRFDFDNVDGFQICLNRTIGVVPVIPFKTYWMVLDDPFKLNIPGPYTAWIKGLNNHSGVLGLFMNPLYAGNGFSDAPTGKNIIHFKRNPDDKLLINRDAVSFMSELYTSCGSTCTAIHAAWFMGAKHITLVGIDGGGGIAECLQQWYDMDNITANYPMAKDYTLNVLDKLCLDFTDFSME